MTADDIIRFYKSGPKAAKRMGLKSASALYQWRRKGRVPPLRQIQVEHDTAGNLVADRQP